MEIEKSMIRVKLESASVKAAFVVLKNISDNTAYMKFTKEGFSVYSTGSPPKTKKAAAGAIKQRADVNYYFPSETLSRYHYKLTKQDGKTILPYYEITIDVDEFLGRIRSLKKDTLSFRVYLSHDTNLPRIIIKAPSSGGERYVSCTYVKKSPNYIDQYSKWYSNELPKAKPLMSIFDGTVVTSKHSKCLEICFSLNTRTNRMSISCYGTSKVPIQSEPFDNTDSDSSYEGDELDDVLIHRSVHMSCNGWLTKLPSLSQTATLLIFCSENEQAPLVLKTMIGTQGIATFSIPNVKEE